MTSGDRSLENDDSYFGNHGKYETDGWLVNYKSGEFIIYKTRVGKYSPYEGKLLIGPVDETLEIIDNKIKYLDEISDDEINKEIDKKKGIRCGTITKRELLALFKKHPDLYDFIIKYKNYFKIQSKIMRYKIIIIRKLKYYLFWYKFHER